MFKKATRQSGSAAAGPQDGRSRKRKTLGVTARRASRAITGRFGGIPSPTVESDTRMTGMTYGVSPSGLVSSAPDGSWAFRNRFYIRSNNRLNFDTPTHVLSPAGSDEHVVLGATGPDKSIVQCESLNLWGSPYPSFDAAASAGRKWRQIAMSVFPRLATGCDFGDDDGAKLQPRVVNELHFRAMFNLNADDQVYWDRLGLLVFSMNPPPAAFISLGFDAHGLSGLSKFPAMIAAAERRYNGLWSDELRLAYNLVHAALGATRNAEARHIFEVTALEALIPYREKHPELSRILDALIDTVDPLPGGFDEDTREVAKRCLGDDKSESVGKFGRELAARLTGEYGGMTPKKFWGEVYDIRSGLAHGNPRDEETKMALGWASKDLLWFVLDILESWTENPGFDIKES
jgi:hypothetical protein